MKILLTYSSRTGNTEKVAKAIYEVMPEGTTFKKMKTVDELLEQHDFIILGCWIDRGTANKEALEFIKKVKNKKVAFFFTLGAYPDSKHAKDSADRIRNLLKENNNEVLGEFYCQGKIDPKLTEKFKSLPLDHPHTMTPERLKRHEEAAKHPDEKDLSRAKETFINIVKKMQEIK
ncbi:flavodoxin family protein [Thermosipho ferrireducens]|uniref:Flavodoxin family protein n=1 Tax=Thermosipho ferrireducens TaxID=2571116 RepID=A0ABX7S8C4_9BACT|nr:flavodoxin family protein [Thermosipho ferrireducens]QTA37533.1 flavodoxin family protein [Thermosipho ferrireducens]